MPDQLGLDLELDLDLDLEIDLELERNLRDAFSHQAAQLDQTSISRLRAVDYHPRRRRLTRAPAIGAIGMVGAGGTAAAIAAIVSLSSGAAPAFAGWKSTPTTAAPRQLAAAAQACGHGLGSPVLTDSRGPYTASIYAEGNTSSVCLNGNGVSMSSRFTSSAHVTVPAGEIAFDGGGMRDSAGSSLTLADGQTGAGVTSVTFELGDGRSVQSTVEHGWYLAWWPGDVRATKAAVTSASGTRTLPYPAPPTLPGCPTSAHCAAGWGSSSGHGRALSRGSIWIHKTGPSGASGTTGTSGSTGTTGTTGTSGT